MVTALGNVSGWMWRHRLKLIAPVLVLAILAPRPASSQIFSPVVAIIVAALNSINQSLTSVIGGALDVMNQTLSTIQGLFQAVQDLYQKVVYPEALIDRARGLVGQVMGMYNQIKRISQVAVHSATLASPKRLEQTLLSRNPLNIGSVSSQYQSVYQPLPPATDASPELRDIIDMTDAASQASMKRAIAIDAIADQELQAADRFMTELQVAAPGTAPMIEAQASAWLVRSHAYTQAALAESMRLRAIDLANVGAEMKSNARHGVITRQQLEMMMERR
ncbi:MAG: hypothetical protein ACUVXB_16380 [Bryobacteraceae bacterium]